jgi:hypothetical protein
MAGRLRAAPLLLLGLAGCPQLENNDWVVGDDASSTEAGGDATTQDSPGGPDAHGGPDAPVGDAPSSGGDAAQDGPADGMPSGGDTGPAPESGSDSTTADGPAAVQKIYCGLTDPRGVALANGNVCWVGDLNPRGLFCAAPDGSSAMPIHVDVQSDASFLLDAFDLWFDATNVYWTNGGHNQVVVRPQSGGQPQEYFSGGGRVSFLAPGDGATLWATDFPDPSDSNPMSSGEVIVGPSAGGTSSNAIYTGEAGAAGVAMYNGNVYWGTPNGIAFGPLAGNATIYRIDSPEKPAAGLAVDAHGVVYFLAGGQSLYRYNTGDTTPTRVYQEMQGMFGAGDVALDDSYVYFSEPDLGCIVRMVR